MKQICVLPYREQIFFLIHDVNSGVKCGTDCEL